MKEPEMTIDEAFEAAGHQLFGNLPTRGEPGWRCYTPVEQRKLALLAQTIWSEATGRVFMGGRG